MTVPAFADNDRVRAAVHAATDTMRSKQVSDIFDGDGHQYVDLVLEGGGVHGIALLGYTHVMESAKIRFLDIAGTSAGAIFALAIAAADTKEKAKSEAVAAELAQIDIRDLMDGDDDAQRFTDALLGEPGLLRYVRLATSGIQVLDDLNKRLGVHPGHRFVEVMSGMLRRWGVETTDDLLRRMDTPPGLLQLPGGEAPTGRLRASRLALITAEVTTETKVELPRMAPLFWSRPGEVNPALFARASMSIPFVYQPLVLEGIPAGDDARNQWCEMAKWGDERDLPRRAVFVDGGIMSNFPIGVFHVSGKAPKAPTFGVKLGSQKRQIHDVTRPVALAMAVFDSARHALDYDFLTQHPDYQHLVTYVDTGDYNWLDFDLSDDAKVELFANGAEAAAQFLVGFEWEKYKALRGVLRDATRIRRSPAADGAKQQ